MAGQKLGEAGSGDGDVTAAGRTETLGMNEIPLIRDVDPVTRGKCESMCIRRLKFSVA